MKLHVLVWLATFGAISAAPELPTFSEKAIPAPVLSLSNAVKSGELSKPGSAGKNITAALRSALPKGPRRLVSRMPIIVPPRPVDGNMPIIAPDPSIDYKLIIKVPGVESAP
jgi:hypothetical protein